MRAECIQGYELQLCEMDGDPAADILTATRLKCIVMKPYKAYMQDFSEADSESMPSHGPHYLTIELLNGKQPPWVLI